MEEKFNDPTPQRPEGTRALDAPMVTIDLAAYITQIRQEPAYQTGDRNAITVFKTAGLRLVLIALHEGALMKTHTAPGIISVQALEGHLRFTTEKETVDLVKGKMLALHAGIPHSVRAQTDAVFLLTLATTGSAT